jgi:hypothetical protein
MVDFNLAVEPLVREAFAAGLSKESERMNTALAAVAEDDQTFRDCLNLGVAISAIALTDRYNGRPGDEQMPDLARWFVEALGQEWGISEADARAHLEALANRRDIGADATTEHAMDTFVRTVFVVGAWMLASWADKDARWWDYLDQILDTIETAQRGEANG